MPRATTHDPRGAPHSGQNLPEVTTLFPHFGQVRAAGGAVDAPQFGQNFTPGGTGWPHFGQGVPPPVGAIGAPQFGQNLFPDGTCALHFGQTSIGPCW